MNTRAVAATLFGCAALLFWLGYGVRHLSFPELPYLLDFRHPFAFPNILAMAAVGAWRAPVLLRETAMAPSRWSGFSAGARVTMLGYALGILISAIVSSPIRLDEGWTIDPVAAFMVLVIGFIGNAPFVLLPSLLLGAVAGVALVEWSRKLTGPMYSSRPHSR